MPTDDRDEDKLREIVAAAIVVLIFFAFYFLVYLPRGAVQ